MIKKVLFFLTFLLLATGGINVWAQTTVGYTEEIDGSNLNARALSNGGLEHLTISSPIFGSSISNNVGTSKQVYLNGTTYNSTDSWRKSESSSDYNANQYVGYTLTIDAGYCMNISNVVARLLVADDTYTWKVVIENSLGSVVYTSSDQTTTKASTAVLSDAVSLQKLTGTVTVKLYMYQGGSTKYFSINYLQLGVTVVEDPRTELTTFGAESTWAAFDYVDNVESSKTSNWYLFKFNDNAATTKVDQSKLSVSSSDESIFTINTYNVGTNSGGNRERINIKIQAVSAGTANVVVSFAGDDNFRPHDPVSIPITINNLRLASRYNNSYPYTWDFAGKDWSSTTIQLKASSNWTAGDNSATNKYAIGAIDCYDIDLIKGLKLTAAANGITADWQNKKLTITGTITLPDLLRGHRVSIVSSAEPSTVPANFTLKSTTYTDGKYTKVYFVSAGTTNPEIVFDSATDIYSIAVEKTRAELVLNTTETSNGTSSYLAANPPTLNLGTSQSWGNYCFDIIDGLVTATQSVPSPDYTVTITPAGILHARYGVEWASANTTRLILTADAVGTAHVSVAINPSGEHGYEVVSPYEFDVRVVQNATPKKWNFESSSHWSTTNEQLSSDYWVTSSDATANPGEVMSNVAFNNTELTKDGTNKIPEMEGLVMTAVKGSSRFNIGQYYRLGNYSKASITIPNMTTGQTITFKVETATSGMERGITATSSNLELISGQVSDKVSYYTFRVTSDGDGEFRQTSEVAGLKIYYIDLKAATPAATELKFVDGSNNDISNKHVNIVSGVSGALDSYFQLSKSSGTAWNDVTVTVDPSSLLTHDGDGSFTMGSGTGMATITARTESSSVETGIAVLYVSVKAQPTVTLSAYGPFSVDYGQDFNNNTSTVTGSSSANLTVLYKSSNERVATVDASGHVTCVGVGTATITAYTEETETYLPAEASYQLTYNAGSVVFQFEPSEVKLALGKNITPYLHYDQKGQLDPESLSFTMSKSGIVTCEVVVDAKQPDKNVIKITSADDASKIGETVIVTAKAQTKGESPIWYYTTIAVTITAEDAVNFDWVNGDDIYVYENTYFPIPGYTGNASGNNHFSNGTDNKNTYRAYYYSISNSSVTWNKENYKLNEGVPDYYVDDTSKALIFWARSSNYDYYNDTLLVYAKAAGTVKLHAKDSQTGAECSPITIHILEKSGLEDAHTAEVSTISFPYTWDFTKNFSESDFANSVFWKSTGSGRYDNTAVWMNEDWADELGEDKFAVNFLGGTGAGSPMALFKGAQIQLGNSTYSSKIGRVQVRPNAGEGNSHLSIIGGRHYLYLPEIPVSRTPNQAYRLYVKAKGQSTTYNDDGSRKDDDCSRIIVEVDNGSGGYTNLGMLVYAEENKGQKDYIVKCLYCDIPAASAGKTLRLDFDKNVELHWIALTTESKTLAKFDNTTYWASTYSYTKDLDLSKSQEVHPNVTAHYASAFSGQNEVTMTKVTNDAVPSGTGMLLKATTTDNPGASYFIANAENVSDYSVPSAISGTNYLVANPEVGTKINANTTIGDDTYTNFTLAYRYKVVHAGGNVDSDYTLADDWSFYRIAPSGMTVSNKNLAYLQVPGDLYVYTSRRAGEATEGNPASQELLKIVFDDGNGSETTDVNINTVTEKTIDSDAWYTLQGVRVNAPTKGGIYIHKGKKVVVK